MKEDDLVEESVGRKDESLGFDASVRTLCVLESPERNLFTTNIVHHRFGSYPSLRYASEGKILVDFIDVSPIRIPRALCRLDCVDDILTCWSIPIGRYDHAYGRSVYGAMARTLISLTRMSGMDCSGSAYRWHTDVTTRYVCLYIDT